MSGYHFGMGIARRYRLIHAPSGIVIARSVQRADNLLEESVGLLGRAALEPDEGLWLPGTPYVHTLGMRFAIDALFLDRRGIGVKTVPSLVPGCWLCGTWKAASCVELAPGALHRAGPVQEGDPWLLEQVA